jgi:Sporulation and spore germination
LWKRASSRIFIARWPSAYGSAGGGPANRRNAFHRPSTGCAAVALVALAGALALSASASAATPTISVFFLRGEQLASVQRHGSSATDAVRALIAGPTRAERKRGFRTYILRGAELHSVNVAGGVATVDLSARFVSGKDSGSLLARLAQLVRTVSATGTPQVRQPVAVARMTYDFAEVGMPVRVVARS